MSLAPLLSSSRCQLVPGARFFSRVIALDGETDVAAQVALALEGFSPFPIAQLYHGYLIAADRKSALVFAAFRRRFTPEEIAPWTAADVVIPDFIAGLTPPAKGPVFRIHETSTQVTGFAWPGNSSLPSLVLCRERDDTHSPESVLAELRRRTGWHDESEQMQSALPEPQFSEDEHTLSFAAEGASGLVFDAAQLAAMDVRDKDLLTEMRAVNRQARLSWRLLIGCVAALALAAVLELGAYGAGWWIKFQQKRSDAMAPAVQLIQNSQMLAARIDDLSGKRLRPLEMIAALNQKRPDGITFLRVATTGLYTMDVEAQTRNADDAGTFEAALRASGLYERLEVRDLRSRDGLTTFVLQAVFKPGALQEKGTP